MIYFIRCSLTRRVKIGRAEDPWKRFSKVQSDSPGDLALAAVEPGDKAREAELHAQFARERTRGEWFENSDRLAAYIQTLPTPVRPPTSRKTREFWGGLSDADVARLTGVSMPMLGQIRAGSRRPSVDLAIRLQRATGKSAIHLVFGAAAGEALALHGLTARAA